MAIWGLHFRKNATVTIGNEEADSDDVKVSPGGKKLIAKFEMKDLLKKYHPKRLVCVINPDGKNRKSAKRIDLRDIPLRIESDEINAGTPEGITVIQNILKNLGFFNHPNATGYYGPITRQAVIEFQKANGIDPVGVVGPITSAKLLELKSNL
ncbi:peptidoglycan-binding protein [bacterium]|nr:peptidoglycan-binding protein [bacterium]